MRTDDLVAFLAARYAEEWGAARDRELVAGLDSSRATREVDAKRAILAEYGHALAAQNKMLASPTGDKSVTYEWENGKLCALLKVMRDFAAAYSDHPDFREELIAF